MSAVAGAFDAAVPFKRVLVANRSDVAVRVFATCRALGITTIGVAPSDDAEALHTRHCDELVALPGSGPAAYLDIDALVSAAVRSGADALHPGWGFRAESPELARACYEQNIVFLGPASEALKLLGDKARARGLARSCGMPVVPGTDAAADLRQMRAFWDEQVAADGPDVSVVLKARAGGGGRGIRVVAAKADLDSAFEQATAEAQAAFGIGALYIERHLTGAHHVEVQIVGDCQGRVRHLWDRECSIQRQHQKLVETAPSTVLPEHARSRMLQAATRLGAAAGLCGLATVEFLAMPSGEFWFLECNPRLQVEHTVTEAVLGLDLVQLQLQMAAGVLLTDLGIDAGRGPVPRGAAVQVRLNAEQVLPDGTVRPAAGVLEQLDIPGGWGVRIDPAVTRGATVNPRYDSLLAKVVCHGPDRAAALRLAAHVLAETRVSGVATNLEVQRAVLDHPDMVVGAADTGWFERTADELVGRAAVPPADLPSPGHPEAGMPGLQSASTSAAAAAIPDAFERMRDRALRTSADPERLTPDGVLLRAPVTGIVVSLADVGSPVIAGADVVVLEAMKMQHPLVAEATGSIAAVHARVGELVDEGRVIAELAPAVPAPGETSPTRSVAVQPAPAASAPAPAQAAPAQPVSALAEPGAAPAGPAPAAGEVPAVATASAQPDPPAEGGADAAATALRADLHAMQAAQARRHDDARPQVVAARHAQGRRTARENVAAVTDDGLSVEYGGLAVAAQRRRRELDDLVTRTPADGLITGLGRINGHLFGPERSTVALAVYDYSVLAGTQGVHSHAKLDRILEVAHRAEHPVVLFAEGGGGRPNDTDVPVVAGLHVSSFAALGRLSGRVPLVGVVAGRCFAGNAALLGTCDVIIATEDSTIGMGGPAMIEGGGLGVVAADEVGPIDVQGRNGVVDVVVADEGEAATVARQYLSYFQGPVEEWTAPDPLALRDVVPEDRKRVYDVRAAVAGIADLGSVLELRAGFGGAAITALARIEGRPVGVIANQPLVNSGAIDAPAADKLARFLQLCEVFGLPVLSLCDTPGFMVGPESEKAATVRHFPRLFVLGGNRSVPLVTVVLRKAYGLGAMAMAGGGFHEPTATLSWPTGEFGAMGLEGAVRLGARKALAEIADADERQARFEALVARAYERGSALNAARHLEVDDVIDPADTRAAVTATLLGEALPPRDGWRNAARRSGLDTW